jgi:hexosaminidase
VKRISIIPQPFSIEETDDVFILDKSTLILAPEGDIKTFLWCRFLMGLFMSTHKVAPRYGFGTPFADKKPILLSVDPTLEHLGPEGYRLSVESQKIELTAFDHAGISRGIQTFLQLVPPDAKGKVPLPGVKIEDRPRFRWRGMHLDVARHFFPLEDIFGYLSLLALHKMNVFHWHLTDDQGWRIEIKKYPRLTKIGAWRRAEGGAGYGGYYSQDDVQEIVHAAKRHHITIVPEIEMPGHCTAALAAYPKLSCSGGPFDVKTGWGIFDDVYCVGKERTFKFLQNVLDEVMELFPGEYIHISGDECPKTRWKTCPSCQKRIRTEGLADENELQSYFIKRIGNYLLSKGKKPIGWDEILEGDLPIDTTVMAWQNIARGVKAAKRGHDVVMTPRSHCYFDYYQAKEDEPEAIGGLLPLEKVYDYEPIPPELSPEEAKHILGAQGNVWTEYMPDSHQVEYMAFPRMCALAEVLWSSRSSRNWDDFQARLMQHCKRLERLGVNYRRLD